MASALDNPYRFVLSFANGTELGEVLDAHDRRISTPNGAVPSASFTVALDHPFADYFLNEDLLLKVYRGPVRLSRYGENMIFHGPVISVEEVATEDSQSVRVSAAGAWWRAFRRYVPASLTNNGFSINQTYSDFRLVWKPILTAVNNDGAPPYPGFMGVDY